MQQKSKNIPDFNLNSNETTERESPASFEAQTYQSQTICLPQIVSNNRNPGFTDLHNQLENQQKQ